MEKPKKASPPRAKAKAARNSRSTVGLNVKLLRNMQGWSQETLAELASMSRIQIGELERGQRGIQLKTLDKIAEALGVEPWELLRPRDELGR